MNHTLACLFAVAFCTQAEAQQRTIVVGSDDCARLAQHKSTTDVTYRPGVEVRGQPVAPADLGGGSRIALPESFTIPITVDMAEKLGIPPLASGALHGGEIAVGTVVVTADGRATFNGQPLQSEVSAALAAACQRTGQRPQNWPGARCRRRETPARHGCRHDR
ncbi:MAG: hypothetical protein FJX53_01800 [Alphaproteobacteria bacterium]|nr:hypothetical protein [Alphaproteobacteria bacterium]